MAKVFKLNQAATICLTYMTIGVLWIFLSDSATTYIFSNDILEMTRFQLYKGIFYVIITGFLFYFMVKKLFDRVNKRNQEIELLFTNPNLGILKVDEKGYFREISPNILKITGYSPYELIGKHLNHLTPEDKKEADLRQLELIANSNSTDGFVFTKHMLSKNGDQIIFKGYGIRDVRGKETNYIAAFQNITEQVHFLEELEAHNRQLREIASQQSHVVRAPLARILGITNLFEGDHSLSQAEVKTLLQNLKSSGEELDQALKDISLKMNHRPE